MAIENKIAYWLRAVQASTQKLLARTDENSRRRTDSGGRPTRGTLERAMGKLRGVFQR
ncbi:hypothetical protein AB0H00_18015 [Nocardia sp. NPDC023852]|uniref:hypothetical protein n=1 Tax=Nocardia sp. NPDC023852 TaxID=3154697 RepID=UPI00340E1406